MAEAEKQEIVTSHSERDILNGCVEWMYRIADAFKEFMDHMGLDYEDIKDELGEDFDFVYSASYFEIVQRLFLWNTHHSGGTSTRQKCKELGLSPDKWIYFNPWKDEEDEWDDEDDEDEEDDEE